MAGAKAGSDAGADGAGADHAGAEAGADAGAGAAPAEPAAAANGRGGPTGAAPTASADEMTSREAARTQVGAGVRVLLVRCVASASSSSRGAAAASAGAAGLAAATARALAASGAIVRALRLPAGPATQTAEGLAAIVEAAAELRPHVLHFATGADVATSAAERSLIEADGKRLALDPSVALEEDDLMEEVMPPLPTAIATVAKVAKAVTKRLGEDEPTKEAKEAARPMVVVDASRSGPAADEVLRVGGASQVVSWPGSPPASCAAAALGSLVSALDMPTLNPAAAGAVSSAAVALLCAGSVPTRTVPAGMMPIVQGPADPPAWRTSRVPSAWPPAQYKEGDKVPYADARSAMEAAKMKATTSSVEVHGLVIERCPSGTFEGQGAGGSGTGPRAERARREREASHSAHMDQLFGDVLMSLADVDARSAELTSELPPDTWAGADAGLDGADLPGTVCYELLLGSKERISVVAQPNTAAAMCPEAAEAALRGTLLSTIKWISRTTPATESPFAAEEEGAHAARPPRRSTVYGAGSALRQVKCVVPEWVANVVRRLASRRQHCVLGAAGIVSVDGVPVDGLGGLGAPEAVVAHDALYTVIAKPKERPRLVRLENSKRARTGVEGAHMAAGDAMPMETA